MTRLMTAAVLATAILATAALVACDRAPDVLDEAATTNEGSAATATASAGDGSHHPVATAGNGAASPHAAADEGWTTIDADALSDAQIAQRVIGNAQRDMLVRELVSTLTAEISANGHGAAVALCNEAAPTIRARIDAHPRVTVGRTAQRLRNPDNAPPAWAADLVATGDPGPHLRVGPDGQLAELSPIMMPAMCTSCHGAEAQIAIGVADALAELYPDDQATGFSAGDLRGWIWTVTEADASP
jgi:hypothetical protein